jgi:hypothetical protein
MIVSNNDSGFTGALPDFPGRISGPDRAGLLAEVGRLHLRPRRAGKAG